MQFNFYPPAICDLITLLRQLPGTGQRGSEKLAFAILDWTDDQTRHFCEGIIQCRSSLCSCSQCGCLYDAEHSCWSCQSAHRQQICVVANAKEAFAIHSTGSFKGCFYVLGGLLDPLKGVEPQHLRIHKLIDLILSFASEEILLALDATLEGDATCLYLRQLLQEQLVSQLPNFKISRLAFGMPMNSSLELVDPATLSRAISAKSYW